jgi:hypothetical protein
MVSARVRGGGGDGGVVDFEHRGDALAKCRVLDTHPPGAPDDPHVAAGVDGKALVAGVAQQLCGAIDGPALDEAGRIEAPRRERVEVAARLLVQALAEGQHPLHVLMRLGEWELAAVEPADLTVLPVGAEGRIDPAQPVEHPVEIVGVDVLVADVDHDRHAHHVLHDGGHARFAFRIADCSELMKASLRSVAPETRSMFALWARSASLRRIGIAFSLMYADRPLLFGYTGTETAVILRVTFLPVVVFLTVITTCTEP